MAAEEIGERFEGRIYLEPTDLEVSGEFFYFLCL